MKRTVQGRGYGPCLVVHQTYPQPEPIAIENIEHGWSGAAVHENEFLWTHEAVHGTEATV
jgi:hypothetical protein